MMNRALYYFESFIRFIGSVFPSWNRKVCTKEVLYYYTVRFYVLEEPQKKKKKNFYFEKIKAGGFRRFALHGFFVLFFLFVLNV